MREGYSSSWHAMFQWPRNGQHLCDPSSRCCTAAPGWWFQWPRNGQHLCDKGETHVHRHPTGGFNGHGTANTSATRLLCWGLGPRLGQFQWPRNGQHLCDGEPVTVTHVEVRRFQWPRNGQHLCDPASRSWRHSIPFKFQWPRNGQHLCDPGQFYIGNEVPSAFQWPRNGQHLCDGEDVKPGKSDSVTVSMATERPTPLRLPNVRTKGQKHRLKFQWPRNGQHLCDVSPLR